MITLRSILWNHKERRRISNNSISFRDNPQASTTKHTNQIFRRKVNIKRFNLLFKHYASPILNILSSNYSDKDKAAKLLFRIQALNNLSPNDRACQLEALSCLNLESEESALHLTLKQGQIECSKVLIGTFPELVLTRDKQWRTPLHLAAAMDSEYLIKLLVAQYGNRSFLDLSDIHGFTALQMAVSHVCNKSAEALLKVGASLDIITKPPFNESSGGFSALHLCAEMNNSLSSNLLISKGANIDINNHWNETPLHWALENHSYKVANDLLRYNATVDSRIIKDGSLLNSIQFHNPSMNRFVRQIHSEQISLIRKRKSGQSFKVSKRSRQCNDGYLRITTAPQVCNFG
ncbi:hypothetical protein ACOME3_001156 [Neoechinorhynchus agilis]